MRAAQVLEMTVRQWARACQPYWSAGAERASLTGGVIAFFVVAYLGAGFAADPQRAGDLALPLDDRIPFIAESVWIYLSVFPIVLLPVFMVRSRQRFRRTALAFAVTIAVSLACFLAYPTSSIRLREEVLPTLDTDRLSERAVVMLYRVDPPYNMFPSLHVSLAILAALSVFRVNRLYGALVLAGVGLIGVSVCTVRQHVLVDALGGAALAVVVDALVVGTCGARRSGGLAAWWGGHVLVGAMVTVLASVLILMYVWPGP